MLGAVLKDVEVILVEVGDDSLMAVANGGVQGDQGIANADGLILVLMAGAGLLVRSFWKLTTLDPGFNPRNVLAARIWLRVPRAEQAAGLVLNPAGYTTTSVAILDALQTIEAPVIEVHITNIHAREPFRRHSYISRVARAVVCGFGTEGYALAITGIAALIGAKE